MPTRLRRAGGTLRGAAGALVEFLHRHEQRARHRGGLRRAHNLGEPALLDPQRVIERHQQAFVDDLHDGARSRIVVVGLAPIDRVGGRERHHPGLGIDRPARRPEAVSVPWLFGAATGLDPILGGLHQISRRRDGIDQLHLLGAVGAQQVALEQVLQRIGGRQDAGDAGRAAGAREQTDLDLRQADAGARVITGHPIVTGERQLEAAAHGGAVDGARPGLPQVSILR